uniref:Calmodulin n=1 Tax=Amphora coffeiformis TaxID=265554 RepID=A0A7S3KWJ7_9STRA|eukprot:scaffold42589_cov176-Amphora_coffeaeformis.AAC.2
MSRLFLNATRSPKLWAAVGGGSAIVLTAWKYPQTSDLEQPFRVKRAYDVQKVLGQGAFGVVYEAVRKQDGTPVALKRMSRKFTETKSFESEVDVLDHLCRVRGGHAHICRLYDKHEDPKHYYLVMELLRGGELMDHLIQHGPYSEGTAATFLRQFAEALVFLHSSGVTHSDLKLENLMLSTNEETTAQLKVVDFGSARRVNLHKEEDGPEKIGGTTAYNPPEYFIKGARLSRSADLWSAGCITYILLTGSHPFDKYGRATDEDIARTLFSLNRNPKAVEVAFDERVKGLSPSCVDLLHRLLEPNPKKRMTGQEFLLHPWVQGLTASWETMQDSHRKLEAYWQATFRREILKKFRHNGSASNDDLLKMFQAIDLDGNGTLEPNEVVTVLKDLGVDAPHSGDMFASLDLDMSGKISFKEFKAIMRQRFGKGVGLRREYWQDRFQSNVLQKFDSKHLDLNKEQLREMFLAMDLDGNGVLSAHEIRVVLRSTGQSEEAISQMVAAVDFDEDGGVSWEEFWQVMRRRIDH